jgi:HK97 family phage prohead protease
MERRFFPVNEECPVETRDDGGEQTIFGRAAVFYDGTEETEYKLWDEMKDREGRVISPAAYERINQKAFNKVLQEKQDVRGLFNHDPNYVLGRTSSGTMKLEKSLRGLDYKINPPNTPIGSSVSESIRRKDVSGSSFSFRVNEDGQKWSFDKERNAEIREITRFDEMYDCGPVTFPAYSSTSSGIRADGDATEARSARDSWQINLGKQVEADAKLATKLADIQKRAQEVEC